MLVRKALRRTGCTSADEATGRRVFILSPYIKALALFLEMEVQRG
ncbi:hypothetical protein J14TS2_22370 [Bacillus sp. J14TS2]|nr:hypothetical protein J14TS2_22370 [Bacillus sp. J14TS2]